MGLVSKTWITAEELLKIVKTCDIIEINRTLYSHFVIYIGNGTCVHVQGPDFGEFDFGNLLIRPSSENDKIGVKSAELLLKIAGSDLVRVNNSESTANALGVDVRPRDEAIRLATADLPLDVNGNVKLGVFIPVTYHALSGNNCEGWATYFRYNHKSGWSLQAANGVVNSTIGTAARLAGDAAVALEDVAKNENVPVVVRALAVTGLGSCIVAKFTTEFVSNCSDIAVGHLLNLFS